MSDNVHVFGFSLSQRCPQVGLIWAGWGEVGIVGTEIWLVDLRHTHVPKKMKHADISGCVRCVQLCVFACLTVRSF